MNHLTRVPGLRNRYHVMRHGESMANVRGIIVSDPGTGARADYGLSPRGREQALVAAKTSGLPGDAVIFSSDFSRATATAEIVREALGAPAVRVSAKLRERYFGDWEGTGTGNYARVWAADEANPCHRRSGVESACDVLDRVTAFVAGLDEAYADRDILLVSHGDTLQILQAGFQRISPAGHRGLPHLRTAEIRRIHLLNADENLR